MYESPEHEPGDSQLSASQRRRLSELEQRLDADSPALAQAMRRGRPPRSPRRRRLRAVRLLIAAAIGVPLVVYAGRIGGDAAAAVAAATLLAAALIWICPRRPH